MCHFFVDEREVYLKHQTKNYFDKRKILIHQGIEETGRIE